MPFVARELLLLAVLASCASKKQDTPLEHELAFMQLRDCTDKMTIGLQWLVDGTAPVTRSFIKYELEHCVWEETAPELRRKIANVLVSEPHRSRFVHLLVSDRPLAMYLLGYLPIPLFRPFLGVADQQSLRAAVLMDDFEMDRQPESISPAWRRFIDRATQDTGDIGAQMRLLEAFRDPQKADVDAPSSPATRREIMRALRRLSTPPSRTNIAGHVPRILHHDPDPAVRREVVRIFGMDARFRNDELREAAINDPDLRVRATAFAALEDVTGVPVPAAYLRPR